MRFRSWLQQLVPEINASNRNANNLENLQKQKGGKLPAEVPLHAKLFFARAVQAGSYEQITIIHRLTTINVSGKRHRKVDSKCAALRSLGTAPLDAMWASTTSTRAEQAWELPTNNDHTSSDHIQHEWQATSKGRLQMRNALIFGTRSSTRNVGFHKLYDFGFPRNPLNKYGAPLNKYGAPLKHAHCLI